ncbi:hypothetical protein LVJ59_17420 [Microbacterium sp. KKR3/1]|uniref:hypothetical protein n=1 Tax=Microbacterium sp. KKR3/1 TaxID=2904241 RepID=UPI001E59908B|nr:hypothetical protein [Microbacterium sp. KKR3/1]MCE0510831.1 hypothetical protein [Microbacterium sp. KKR3/1]
MIVKENDTHPVEFKANADLTGATVRLTARTRTGEPIDLPCSIVDAGEGLVQHVLTGELPVGTYRVELETTISGAVVTFPNKGYATLTVDRDLD